MSDHLATVKRNVRGLAMAPGLEILLRAGALVFLIPGLAYSAPLSSTHIVPRSYVPHTTPRGYAQHTASNAYQFVTVDVPGAIETFVHTINNSGTVTGFFRDGTGNHGFSCVVAYNTVPHQFITFDDPFGPGRTFAKGINNRGDIVGYYIDSGGRQHGFIRADGLFKTVDVPSAIGTNVTGINDYGQLAGEFTDVSGGHGFVFLDQISGFERIDDPLATRWTAANAINDTDTVTGSYSDAAGVHGFVLKSGQYTTLNDPYAPANTYATGTNDNGITAGFYYDHGNTEHGFVESNGQFTTVDDPDGTLTFIGGINDVGLGFLSGQYNHAYAPPWQGFVAMPLYTP